MWLERKRWGKVWECQASLLWFCGVASFLISFVFSRRVKSWYDLGWIPHTQEGTKGLSQEKRGMMIYFFEEAQNNWKLERN